MLLRLFVSKTNAKIDLEPDSHQRSEQTFLSSDPSCTGR
jgi:hypothetical protein